MARGVVVDAIVMVGAGCRNEAAQNGFHVVEQTAFTLVYEKTGGRMRREHQRKAVLDSGAGNHLVDLGGYIHQLLVLPRGDFYRA